LDLDTGIDQEKNKKLCELEDLQKFKATDCD